MQNVCGDVSHALISSRQSISNRLSDEFQSVTVVIIDRVQTVVENVLPPVRAVQQLLLNNMWQWMLIREQVSSEVFSKIKFSYFSGTLTLQKYFLIMKRNDFRGELSDVSAKTATLQV